VLLDAALKSSEKNNDSKDQFQSVMKHFFIDATKQFEHVENELTRNLDECNQLSIYFGEPKDTKSELFFIRFSDFLISFEQADAHLEEIKEIEIKKQKTLILEQEMKLRKAAKDLAAKENGIDEIMEYNEIKPDEIPKLKPTARNDKKRLSTMDTLINFIRGNKKTPTSTSSLDSISEHSNVHISHTMPPPPPQQSRIRSNTRSIACASASAAKSLTPHEFEESTPITITIPNATMLKSIATPIKPVPRSILLPPCRTCDCFVFVVHPFKKGICNSCFHSHSAAVHVPIELK
jgi:hypothetical protein